MNHSIPCTASAIESAFQNAISEGMTEAQADEVAPVWAALYLEQGDVSCKCR